jgi:hypothetical protein
MHRLSLLSATLLLCATPTVAQNAPEPFLPFAPRAYRLVNSVAWTPGGDSMLVALFYREVRAHRNEPSDTTMPELGLYVTSRAGDGWTEPSLLPVSGRFPDYEPALLADGSVLVFNSKRPWADGRLPPRNDLWMAERTAAGWGTPRAITAVNTFEAEESYATITADGRMIFLKGLGGEVYDLYESRLGPDRTFGAPVRSSVSTDQFGEADPMVSPDGSFLIFTRWDPAVGWDRGCDLYIAFREGAGWGAPVPLTGLNNATSPDFGAALSPDGKWLYYRSSRQFLRTPLAPVLEAARAKS